MLPRNRYFFLIHQATLVIWISIHLCRLEVTAKVWITHENTVVENGKLEITGQKVLKLECRSDEVAEADLILHYAHYAGAVRKTKKKLRDYNPLGKRLQRPSGSSASMILTNLSYTDSGSYVCNSTQTEESAEVYVFVDDGNPRNVFMKPTRKQGTRQSIVYGPNDEFSYFKCPTTTTKIDEAYLRDSSHTKLLGLEQFDPKIGFKLPRNTLPDAVGKYQFGVVCKARREGHGYEDEISFDVKVRNEEPGLVLRPHIAMDTSAKWAYVGGPFSLTCEETFDAEFGWCEWRFPARFEKGSRVNRTRFQSLTLDSRRGRTTLTINRARLADSGHYTCNCTVGGYKSHNYSTVDIIVSRRKGQIRVTQSITPKAQTVREGENVQFSATYEYFPNSAETCHHIYKRPFKDKMVDIVSTSRCKTAVLDDSERRKLRERSPEGSRSPSDGRKILIVELRNVSLSDSGTYEMNVTADGTTERFAGDLGVKRNVSVMVQPQLNVDYRYLVVNKTYIMECLATGYPVGKRFWWYFKPENAQSWKQPKGHNGYRTKSIENSIGTWELGSRLTTVAIKSGRYCCLPDAPELKLVPVAKYCGARNAPTSDYRVSDIASRDRGIALRNLDGRADYLEGDELHIRCKIHPSNFKFRRSPWSFLDRSNRHYSQLDEPDKFIEKSWSTQYYKASELTVTDLTLDDNGRFICSALNLDSRTLENRTIDVIVLRKIAPTINVNTSSPVTHPGIEGKTLELRCLILDGRPKPTVTWYHENQELKIKKGMSLVDDGQVLRFSKLTAENAGDYICEARSSAGTATHAIHLSVLDNKHPLFPKATKGVLIAIGVVVLLGLVALTAFVIITKRMERKKTKELEELYTSLMNSTKTPIANRRSTILDPHQPLLQQVENLPYDMRYELPDGDLTTGKVLGEGNFGKVVDGMLLSDGSEVKVAVKVPRNGMDREQQRQLLCELKIMIHVGAHPHIVGLFGAVTKRMVKGQLYVVVELCGKGSLDQHLLNSRGHFVCELVQTPVTPEVGQELEGYLTPNSISSSVGSGWKYKVEVEPHWSEELENRRNLDQATLATSDLISYAYQTTRGLEFLASKGVIHRDIAARNILLTAANIIKISDFGLTLENEIDAKNCSNDTPMPVRWMAVESIVQKEFTVKSDVWSFGVLMWEIFTLAKQPYADQPFEIFSFIARLQRGERLPRPQYAPRTIYELMVSCWQQNPAERPTFSELRFNLSNQLRRASNSVYEDLEGLNLLPIYDHFHPQFPRPLKPDNAYIALNQTRSLTEDDRHTYVNQESVEMDTLLPQPGSS